MRLLPVLVLAMLGMFSQLALAASMPKVHDKAPEFALVSNEGHKVSLRDYKGKWVVLYFYPRNFTGGCTVEAHNFQSDLDKYTKFNAVILGVSVDSATTGDRSQKLFCEKEGLHFKTLSDESTEVSQEYGSLSILPATDKRPELKMAARNTFIIDPAGRIARIFEKVNPATHSEEVLKALVQLQER